MSDNLKNSIFTVTFLLHFVTLFWMWHFDLLAWINEIDITKFTFIIMGLYIISFARVGYLCFRQDHSTNKIDTLYFSADQFTGIGLLGTIIGFMYILLSQFTEIDVADTEGVIILIQNMATGMGTALVTTAAGLIASMSLKLGIRTFLEE